MNRAKFIEVSSYLEANFTKSIGWPELERRFGLSHWGLHKLFKEFAKVTPIDYRNQLRINYAKRMIKYRGLLNKGVAIKCGFGSVSQFNRVFKEFTGLTLTEFRNI